MEINSYKLKLYSHVKYLEILIDEVLSWIKQIESICAKLANSNGILSKLRHFVPKDISSRYIIPHFILIFFTVLTLNRISRIQWRCSLLLLSTQNTLFGKFGSKIQNCLK